MDTTLLPFCSYWSWFTSITTRLFCGYQEDQIMAPVTLDGSLNIPHELFPIAGARGTNDF